MVMVVFMYGDIIAKYGDIIWDGVGRRTGCLYVVLMDGDGIIHVW